MKNNLHPLQSPLWGEFREKTNVKVVRSGKLQITIHGIPGTKYKVGYLPKGPDINEEILGKVFEIGKKENCIFIQLEPNVEKSDKTYKFQNLVLSSRPLFTKYTFILDLTKSEEEILKNMHSKTRYNIRVAEKKGVVVKEDNSEKAFKEYLRLSEETTKRQKFFAHSKEYHIKMWETLKPKDNKTDKKNLTAHLFNATYNGETIVSWILFVLGDSLYYPYGASSSNYREVMASNLMMWEAIKYGKKMGLKEFDMWGSLGSNPDVKDPWYGFHRFKEGYGGRLVEFIGSYDLVIDKNLYFIYTILNKARWAFLKLK